MIKLSEHHARPRLVLLRRAPDPLDRRDSVLRHANPLKDKIGEVVLHERDATLRSDAVEAHRLPCVLGDAMANLVAVREVQVPLSVVLLSQAAIQREGGSVVSGDADGMLQTHPHPRTRSHPRPPPACTTRTRAPRCTRSAPAPPSHSPAHQTREGHRGRTWPDARRHAIRVPLSAWSFAGTGDETSDELHNPTR